MAMESHIRAIVQLGDHPLKNPVHDPSGYYGVVPIPMGCFAVFNSVTGRVGFMVTLLGRIKHMKSRYLYNLLPGKFPNCTSGEPFRVVMSRRQFWYSVNLFLRD